MNILYKIMNTLKDSIVKNYFTFLVVGIVLFAFILRYYHTKMGLPYLYNWDEPQTASTALKIMKTGDFNPHFFNYGSMMIYSNLIVDILHYLSLMGHPDTAQSYLTSLNEIKINADTGWHWTISHPSFYHWNRVLTAILGTGTVFVTYLIGKCLFDRWIGLIAALFLATLPLHITQSAWASTDAPVAFFVLTVVLFSLLFIKYKKLSYFLLSLIFVGISIATKYNAALTMLLPLTSLIIVYFQSRETVKIYMWFLIPVIPIFIFFLIMPYAIIDMTTFLKNVGWEVRHYKILGHGVLATMPPGWKHFSFQMQQFYQHIGLINTIVVTIGILGIFFRPLLAFTLILPIVYIIYMTGMKVSFHRNFVQVYPFISLLFASGIYILYYFLRTLQKKTMIEDRNYSLILVTLIVFGILAPQVYSSYKHSRIIYHSKDTRSESIKAINKMKGYKKVVFAKELRMHNQDLRQLKLPYDIKPINMILSHTSNKDFLYVLPQYIVRRGKKDKKATEINKNISIISQESILKKIGILNLKFVRPIDIFSSETSGVTNIKIHSINPVLIIAHNIPYFPMSIKVNPLYKFKYKTWKMVPHYTGNPLAMKSNGSITSPIYNVIPGRYKLVVQAKGENAFGENAKLKIQVWKLTKNKQNSIAKTLVETRQSFDNFILPFELIKDSNISIVVSFVNDKWDPKTKEDRNAYLKSISIEKQ